MNAAAQLMLSLSPGPWEEVRDGDPRAAALFDRHYSRIPKAIGKLLIVGPGQKIVLMTPCLGGLFAWRVSKSKDPTATFGDVNCAIFRNETELLASSMILEAEQYARAKWGPRRLYTYVSRKKVRSRNPGYCFLRAGWRRCGVTKTRRLLILEKLP